MPSLDIIVATSAHTADAVRLFDALHTLNAALDPRFALADNWQHLVEEYLHQSEHSDDSVWLLAYTNGQAIGFVLVEVHLDSPLYRHRHWAEIVGLYVDPAYRGSNVADVLMEHAFTWAMQHNLHVMQLYVTAANHQARRFYEKQGFTDAQYILRRTLTDTDVSDAPHVHHASHRLHFSEGGARPLDMHDRHHQHPSTPD